MTARIRLEKEGPVGRVILARANRGYALDSVMAAELFDACAQCERDPQLRVVHLGAAGVVTDVESRATPEFQDGVRRLASREGGS